MEKYATLRVEEKPGDLLLATLDRPGVANAFNRRPQGRHPRLQRKAQTGVQGLVREHPERTT